MNNAEIQQLRILGELLSHQKQRVVNLIDRNRLKMSDEIIEFTKELILISANLNCIMIEDVNTTFDSKFKSRDDFHEFALISEVLRSEIEKSIGVE